jgi:hypothetical protein
MNLYSDRIVIGTWIRFTVRKGYFWILPNGRWFGPQDLFSSPPGDDEEPGQTPQ